MIFGKTAAAQHRFKAVALGLGKGYSGPMGNKVDWKGYTLCAKNTITGCVCSRVKCD